MFRVLFAAMIVLACVSHLQPVAAQETTAVAPGEPDVVDIVFTEIERRLIRDYYERVYRDWAESGGKGKHKNKGLPPGLARKGTLPPGLAKQLVQNGTLPPGLAKRLPSDLVPLLPVRPDWQDVVIVDEKVLLIQRATNLILDIILVAAAEASD